MQIHDIHVANISLARRIGVRIAMGSDAGTPGNHCGDNMQELEVMVREAGFPALEAIQAATINAATLMRLEDQLGTLEQGKVADLVVVGANPLDDVSAMRSVPLVIHERGAHLEGRTRAQVLISLALEAGGLRMRHAGGTH